MNRAWQNLRAFCAEFGLSPSSRGRMEIPDAGDDEDEDLD
jgi:phage terminase small subunit